MSSQTAIIAKPIDRNGELYQQRAVEALSILVRQALASRSIYYGEIALELGMENPRNMNFVLGSIGTSLRRLADQWHQDIPPLQALVVNRSSEMPGEGFAEFAPDPTSFRNAPLRVRRQIVTGILSKVFAYGKWSQVLAHFDIAPLKAPDLGELMPPAVRAALGGRGESDAHKQFKLFVSLNPHLIGIEALERPAQIEYSFPSSDTVDVLFTTRLEYVAVEVKSRISSEFDVLRGVFQCVKYQALLDAVVAVEQRTVDTRTILVLEGELPQNLRSIVHTLQVQVKEMVVRDRAT